MDLLYLAAIFVLVATVALVAAAFARLRVSK